MVQVIVCFRQAPKNATYLMRPLDECGDFCVAKCEYGGPTGILDAAKLKMDLSGFIELATISSQCCRIILVSKVDHLYKYFLDLF